MNRFRKFIFILSLTLIAVIILIFLAGNFIPLEFANAREEEQYESGRFVVLFAATLLTITGTVKKKDDKKTVSAKIFLTMLAAMIPVFIAFGTGLDGMCGHSIVKTLFEKNNDPSEKIVIRDFGCGATDSSPSVRSVEKLSYYTSHFYIASPVDTMKLDRDQWVRVQ